MNRLEQEIQKVLTHYNYIVEPHHHYYQKVKENILAVCNDLMDRYRGYEDQFESHNYFISPPMRLVEGEIDPTCPSFVGYLTYRDVNSILDAAAQQIIHDYIQRHLLVRGIDPLNIIDTQRWIDVQRHIDAHYRFVISNPPPTQTARNSLLEDPEVWERAWEGDAYKIAVPHENGEVCEKCWIESGIVVSEAGCRHSTYLK